MEQALLPEYDDEPDVLGSQLQELAREGQALLEESEELRRQLEAAENWRQVLQEREDEIVQGRPRRQSACDTSSEISATSAAVQRLQLQVDMQDETLADLLPQAEAVRRQRGEEQAVRREVAELRGHLSRAEMDLSRIKSVLESQGHSVDRQDDQKDIIARGSKLISLTPRIPEDLGSAREEAAVLKLREEVQVMRADQDAQEALAVEQAIREEKIAEDAGEASRMLLQEQVLLAAVEHRIAIHESNVEHEMSSTADAIEQAEERIEVLQRKMAREADEQDAIAQAAAASQTGQSLLSLKRAGQRRAHGRSRSSVASVRSGFGFSLCDELAGQWDGEDADVHLRRQLEQAAREAAAQRAAVELEVEQSEAEVRWREAELENTRRCLQQVLAAEEPPGFLWRWFRCSAR